MLNYDPENFELQQKIRQWNTNPEKFQKEGLSYLLDHKDDSFEYAEFLFFHYLTTGDIFKADDLLIDAYKKNPVSKKLLELYFILYDQFSDTPDEALNTVTILNKIEPDVNKHYKLIDLLKQSNKNLLAAQEFDNLLEKYPENINLMTKVSMYLHSEVPEYIEKAKLIIKDTAVEEFCTVPSQEAINAGSLKFYAGENYDGLIHHFGGEDFRPSNFVSKRAIPNSSIANFNNKSVVITPYRGMGDSMILSRFIPKFIEKWPQCKITIATEKSMIPLYKTIPGVHRVGSLESCAGRLYDVCLGVNMLSRYLRDQLVDDQGRIPYHEWVSYPKEYDYKWKELLPTDKPLIGINWKGSQRLGGAPSDDDDGRNLSRDIELTDFSYIIKSHPDKNFICLNPDISPEEREWIQNQSNVIIPTKIKDFADTSAIIKICDVVVSVDTSISTLSASLSKNTIVLAKFWPDYRWLYYEKWWDLSKVEIKVHRKQKHDDNWMYPICETIVDLKQYDQSKK